MPGVSYPRTSGGDYSDDQMREFYRVAKDVIGISSDLFNPDAVGSLGEYPHLPTELDGVSYSSLALQQMKTIGVEPKAIAHIIKSIPAVGCESLPSGMKVHYDPAANLSVIVEANGKVYGVYPGKMALMNVPVDLSELKPVGSTAPPNTSTVTYRTVKPVKPEDIQGRNISDQQDFDEYILSEIERLHQIEDKSKFDSTHPSTPVGRKGMKPEYKVPHGTNKPAVIAGRVYADHALDQMQSRGITPSVIEKVLRSGTQFTGNKPGRILYYDSESKISVVTEADGKIVTVYSRAKEPVCDNNNSK